MTQLLCASQEVDLKALKLFLADQGIETDIFTLPGSEARVSVHSVERCFLISPEQGVVSVGERVVRLREWLENGTPLVVCTPRPTLESRRALHESGASEVITPGGWTSHNVADRILAELTLIGELQPASFGALLGATAAMRNLYHRIEKVAPLAEPVLILGETGTGKELVAGEIHRRSSRRGEIVAINCAALTPELLESELFGHERGAFSGAVSARRGLLAEAGSGTVFLDEIGDLALSSQAKLLRALEERRVRPVGSNRWQEIHARIVLATHRDLEEACEEGRFRLDLFHRISGLTLRLPPLRERKADLLLLAHHFLQVYNEKYAGRRVVPLGAFDSLFRYDWPGNVRELLQAVWQAAAYADSDEGPISAVSLLEWGRRREHGGSKRNMTFDPALDTWKDVLERTRASYFRAILAEAGGNKELAAKRAGLSRSQFYEILKQVSQAREDSNETK
jgi:DNA-binding NtrC family response regulator